MHVVPWELSGPLCRLMDSLPLHHSESSSYMGPDSQPETTNTDTRGKNRLSLTSEAHLLFMLDAGLLLVHLFGFGFCFFAEIVVGLQLMGCTHRLFAGVCSVFAPLP